MCYAQIESLFGGNRLFLSSVDTGNALIFKMMEDLLKAKTVNDKKDKPTNSDRLGMQGAYYVVV